MKVVERILEEGHIGGAPERSAALAGVVWRVTRRVRVRVRTARVGRRPAPRPPAPRLAQRAPRARRRRRRALWDTTQDWDGIGKQVRKYLYRGYQPTGRLERSSSVRPLLILAVRPLYPPSTLSLRSVSIAIGTMLKTHYDNISYMQKVTMYNSNAEIDVEESDTPRQD